MAAAEVPLAELTERVRLALEDLPDAERGDHVSSDLLVVNRALARIRDEGLARGTRFCEWGSGIGGVCVVAVLNGFRASGIEIRGDLIASARQLVTDLGLEATFAEGSYLLPGDEDLASDATHTRRSFDGTAWDELGFAPGDCDVVFAYPWPGEESCVDRAFARHASPGALLLTFHDWDYLQVQRKQADTDPDGELSSLGWM